MTKTSQAEAVVHHLDVVILVLVVAMAAAQTTAIVSVEAIAGHIVNLKQKNRPQLFYHLNEEFKVVPP